MRNKIVTFIENKDKSKKLFNKTDIVFSIPYSVILEAEDYCQREQLDFCFVLYLNNFWVIRNSKEDCLYYIKVTGYGISPETKEKYSYTIEKVVLDEE